MSDSLIPRRRRFSTVDGDDEEEVTIGSPGSRSSKRTRHDSDYEDGISGLEQNERPVLPEAFRRSPQNSHTFDALGSDNVPSQAHQPGSIVRVTVQDFVTYSNASFHPGPNLNMIIGPNGTGKSTLVSAICLGLGSPTSTLGRAKEIGEFVKHGCRKARIEVELAADLERHSSNVVVTCVITKEGDKSSFWIDGKSASGKAVRRLCQSFHIQVDNLCQFLPQDRVVEFSRLTPEDMLTETLRAAASDTMVEWHQQLQQMRREQTDRLAEQLQGTDILRGWERRQEAQRPDYERLQDRSHLQEQKTLLERFRIFPQYKLAKDTFELVKTDKKIAQKELNRLERQCAPNLQAVKDKTHYLERLENFRSKHTRLVTRAETAVDDLSKHVKDKQTKIEEKLTEINAERNSTKTAKAEKIELERKIREIDVAIRNGDPGDVDFAAYNERIRDFTRQVREKTDRLAEISDEMRELQSQGKQRVEIINRLKSERENLHSQVGRQKTKLHSASRNGDAAKAWEWIQENRDAFTGEVFGPPLIECSIKNQRYADIVESCLQVSDMCAFTVTNAQDFQMLQQQVYGHMRLDDVDLRSTVAPLSAFQAPCSQEEMQRLNIDCWLTDVIEGPERVLAMLCDNRNLHRTGFITREIDSAEYKALCRSHVGSWFTPTKSYVITRRTEYGISSTRVNPNKKARLFTDVPIDHGADQANQRQAAEANGELGEINEAIERLKDEAAQVRSEVAGLTSQKQALEKEKNQKQTKRVQFDALPTKKAGAEAKLGQVIKVIQSAGDRQMKVHDQIDDLTLQKGQKALDLANSLNMLHELTRQLVEAEVLILEASSDREQLESRQKDVIQTLSTKKDEVQRLQRTADELRGKATQLMEECRERFPDGIPSEQKEAYDRVSQWTPDQLETEIESLHARLEMVSGGNTNVIAEFEARAKKIEDKSRDLQAFADNLTELQGRIDGLQEQWEPRLDELVAKISDAFADNFNRIGTVGEVAVHKDEDFSKWAIQIKVKFRENETLSLLDSHRQSGGERAITTIFYLMALQSLARAPFRVVDEINQGMDQRFERLVHSRMVDVACEEDTSQYFLITPKLLSGLKYAEGMRVHCIASGEYMPDAKADGNGDGDGLNFQALAEAALRVKAAAG